jgi:hypothetical protein
MPNVAPLDVATGEEPFDLSRPSPLPLPVTADRVDDDVVRAEQSVAHADRGGNLQDRVRSRLALADAWLARFAVGPALEVLRDAEKLEPGHSEILERLARTYPRASLLREAALARRSIAQQRATSANLHAAACAWLRTDDHAEAVQALDDLTRLAPDDPRTAALLVTFARLRSGVSGGTRLVATLLECAAHARKRDDRERWREHALNAWIESKGAEGGELLAEALAATGRPRAAVYVAAEAAARALLGAPSDLPSASRLLVRCARLAESAGLPGEAASAWIVHALMPEEFAHDARESLRDVLAEQGRAVELAARLRADARRASPTSRSAAWKGVAAIEIASQPSLAAQALGEALRHQPDDAEAFELLASLAQDPAVSGAVRDTLWSVARSTSLDQATRTRLLLWLAELEEIGGDVASAEACLAAIDDPAPEAFAGIARLHASADAQVTRVVTVLRALDATPAASLDAAFERLLSDFSRAPGAFRDVRLTAKVLGPRALHDERVAALWVRTARRSEDPAQLPAVLNRLAMRAELPSVRVRAALERADLLDRAGDLQGAADGLALLLDELPSELAVAASLCALAEHSDDAALALDALRAMMHAANDAWERDFITRFTGKADGIFGVFASCLSEPSPTRQRCDDIARLHDLVGDSTALLALRVRALMAHSGSIAQALEVSRRFASFAPLSPEATIAWFGAANVAGDAAQIADAALAVVRSLASVRDVSAVTRTAMSRLEPLGAPERARQVALEAAGAVGLADRAFRGAVLEMLRRVKDTPETLPLIEHLAACPGATEEHVAALRTLADGYRRKDAPSLELAALWRLRAFAREHTSARLLELLPRVGDRARYAKLLAEQLDVVRDPTERRAYLLAIAAEYAAADPPCPADAIECVDRIAQEQGGAAVQGLVVRALIALGQPEAALGRLMRWSAECADDAAAAARMLCATRVARDVMRSPARALTTLRAFLRRIPSDAEALEIAEAVAVEAAAFDTIFAIYNDLSSFAAGEHARHAIAYRRACLLERAGRVVDALDEQFALFMKGPALGATFSAVRRLASASGRHGVLVRALGLLATTSSSPEVRARYYLEAAEVARSRSYDPELGLMLELLSFQNSRDVSVEGSLRRHARELRGAAPAVARVAIEQLIDESLNAAAQTWDDNARRVNARHALELALADLDDAERAAESAGTFLKAHDDPADARRTVLDLVECFDPPAAVRVAVLALLPSHRVDVALLEATPLRPASARPLRAPTLPSVRPVVAPASERPSQNPGRTARASQRPPKQPFNPRAAIEAGLPVRSATPLFTSAGSGAPRRSSLRPPPMASSPPPAPAEAPPDAAPRGFTLRPPRAPSSSPPEVTLEPLSPSPPPFVTAAPRILAVPAAPPPLPSRPARAPTVAALREAAEAGDDLAASTLARHLALSDDTRAEALLLQRRRFEQNPSRLDALGALIDLYSAMRMRNESAALASVHAVLSGRALTVWPEPPVISDLTEPLEGVARVLFPPHYGPFPELGALVWDALNGGRRDATRSHGGLANDRTFVSPPNDFGRMFSSAVRLLQLPKATPLVVRTDLADGVEMAAGSTPPTVLVAVPLAHDTARARFLIGLTLESTRVGHLPVTALGAQDGERLVAAVRAAFGRVMPARIDPAVGRLASRIFDALQPRVQRRAQDLVAQLGDRLSWASWREAVAHAQMHAAMLVCGDFRTAAESILRGAPQGVSREPAQALASYPPLRALARFAVSEEYLLLRWQRARGEPW